MRAPNCFILTENADRADATLRGAAEDLVFTEVHTSSDSLNAHTNFASGRTTRRTGGSYKGIGIGENKSEHSAERCHAAMAAVHLGNNEGDVIWSTTQESLGGKFRGASADVADKIARQLIADWERARKPTSAPAPASGVKSPPK